MTGLANKIYGLGRVSTPVKGDLVKYWMYPRVFNTTTYSNHKKNTTESFDIELYHSATINQNFGIRLTESKCFTNMVNFINTLRKEKEVTLVESGDANQQVKLFGEVLIVNQDEQKRALNHGEFSGFFHENFGKKLKMSPFGLGI